MGGRRDSLYIALNAIALGLAAAVLGVVVVI